MIAPADILSDAHQTTVNRQHRRRETKKNTSPNAGKMCDSLPPPPIAPEPLRAASPPKNQNASFTDVLTPKTPKSALNGSHRLFSTEKSPETRKVDKEVHFERTEEQREPTKDDRIQEKNTPKESEVRQELAIESDPKNVEEEKMEEEVPKQPVEQIRALPFEFFTPQSQPRPVMSSKTSETAPVSTKPSVQPPVALPTAAQPVPDTSRDPKHNSTKTASLDTSSPASVSTDSAKQNNSSVVSALSQPTIQAHKVSKPSSKMPPTPGHIAQEERKRDGSVNDDSDKNITNLKSRMEYFKQQKLQQQKKRLADAAGMITAGGVLEINAQKSLNGDRKEADDSGDAFEKSKLSTSDDLKKQHDDGLKKPVKEHASVEPKTKDHLDNHRQQKDVSKHDEKPTEPKNHSSDHEKREERSTEKPNNAQKKNKRMDSAAELQLSTEMREVSLNGLSEEPVDDSIEMHSVPVEAMTMQPEPCKEVEQNSSVDEPIIPVKETAIVVPTPENTTESLEPSLGEESQHSAPVEEAKEQQIIEDQDQNVDRDDREPTDMSPAESSDGKMSSLVPDTEAIEHTPQSSPMEECSRAPSPILQPASATSPTEEATPAASPSVMVEEPVVSTASKEIHALPESDPNQKDVSSTHVEKQSSHETSEVSQKAVAADHELATEEESLASSALDDTINAVASASNHFTVPTAPSRKKRPVVPEVSMNNGNHDNKALNAVKPLGERPDPNQQSPSTGRGRKRVNQPVVKPIVVTKAALKHVPPPAKKTQTVATGGRIIKDEAESPFSISRSPTPLRTMISPYSIDDKRRMKSPLTPRNTLRGPLDADRLRRELDMTLRGNHSLNSEKECKVENQPKPCMFFDPNFKPNKLGRSSVAPSSSMSSRAGSSERSTPYTPQRYIMCAAKKQKDDAEDEDIRNRADPVGIDGEKTLRGIIYPESSMQVKTETPDVQDNPPKRMGYRERNYALNECLQLQGSSLTGSAASAAKRVKQEEAELKQEEADWAAYNSYRAVNLESSRLKRTAEAMSPELEQSMRILKRLTKEYDLPRVSKRFRHFLRVKTHPNGGAHTLSCDYLQFRDKLNRHEIDVFCRQFLRLGMAEFNELAVFCIAIMENGANGMANCFKMLVNTDPTMVIKYGELTGSSFKTKPLKRYYNSCLKNYMNGTFRYGPLDAVTLTGRKKEEIGKLYPKILDNLNAHPFLAPVMPWGEFTEMYGTPREASNDGPILWVRPGEQTVPSTNMKDESLIFSKRNNIRETDFLDRTLSHADIAGDDDTKSAYRTGAVGVLQCIPGTDVEHLSPEERPAVKEVVAFAADDMDRVFTLLNMDFYSFPTRQCKIYVDEGKLNSMRRLGIRYSKFDLRTNDMYFIPRNIVHQFRTTRASVSIAWHTRLLHQFKYKGLKCVPDPAYECHSEYSDCEEPPVKRIQKCSPKSQ